MSPREAHSEAFQRFLEAQGRAEAAMATGDTYAASVAFTDAREAFDEGQAAWRAFMAQPEVRGLCERAGIKL